MIATALTIESLIDGSLLEYNDLGLVNTVIMPSTLYVHFPSTVNTVCSNGIALNTVCSFAYTVQPSLN